MDDAQIRKLSEPLFADLGQWLDLMSNAADVAVHTATVNGRLSAHSRHRCRAVTQS
jgi:3-deoxy-D-manno-octulosonic-acid transferase